MNLINIVGRLRLMAAGSHLPIPGTEFHLKRTRTGVLLCKGVHGKRCPCGAEVISTQYIHKAANAVAEQLAQHGVIHERY